MVFGLILFLITISISKVHPILQIFESKLMSDEVMKHW